MIRWFDLIRATFLAKRATNAEVLSDFSHLLIVRSVTTGLMKQVNSDIITCQFMKEFFCEKCDKWFNEACKLRHRKVSVHEGWLRHVTFVMEKCIKLQRLHWIDKHHIGCTFISQMLHMACLTFNQNINKLLLKI